MNKLDELNTLIVQLEYNVSYICISETWMKPDIEDRFTLDDQRYQMFCKSRVNKAGGGSAVYAMKTPQVRIKEISIFEFKTAETVTLHVSSPNNPTYLICQMYRPPDSNPEVLIELEQFLMKVNAMNITAYITGDLNIDLFSVTNNSYNESCFSCMCSYGFLPTISKATRNTSSSCTLTDNIFCNDISKTVTTGVILTDISDNFSISAVTNISRVNDMQSNKVITTFNHQKMDDLMQHLDSSLQHLTLESDPEQACENIIEAFTDSIALFSKTVTFSRKRVLLNLG